MNYNISKNLKHKVYYAYCSIACIDDLSSYQILLFNVIKLIKSGDMFDNREVKDLH